MRVAALAEGPVLGDFKRMTSFSCVAETSLCGRQRVKVIKEAMQRPVEKVRSGVDRVIRNWAEATELVRQVAGEPGYDGPSIEEMEEIATGIAQVRAKVSDWTWATAAALAHKGPRLSPAVHAAIRELSGRG